MEQDIQTKERTARMRERELQKTSLITIIVNVALTAAKLVIGLISSSTAVVSDAAHSFSDVFTTILVMVGIKISGGEADKEHPYGHYRIESVVSMSLAFVLVAMALVLGWEGIKKITEQTQLTPSWLALVVTALSIVSKEWMFQYTKRKAKRYNSSSLMSDAWHHRSDAFSSVAVLVGVLGTFFGVSALDPIATLAVCLILLKVAFDIGKVAVNQLIDHAADRETIEIIRSAAMSVEGVRGIDLLKTRVCNNVVFVDIEITVAPDISVLDGHRIADSVHDKVEGAGLPVEHCMVHVNPHINAS